MSVKIIASVPNESTISGTNTLTSPPLSPGKNNLTSKRPKPRPTGKEASKYLTNYCSRLGTRIKQLKHQLEHDPGQDNHRYKLS